MSGSAESEPQALQNLTEPVAMNIPYQQAILIEKFASPVEARF